MGTNPRPSSYATADPKRKPRASIPTILSMFLPRQRSKNKSMDARNNTGSFKIGVMSLKAMPFFGKSDTSRTAARSFSTIPEAIGANASGLEQNVNHRAFKTLHARLASFLSCPLFFPDQPSRIPHLD